MGISLDKALLIPGVGIEGDRYSLERGTYSAKFMKEPGRQLTIISKDSIDKAIKKSNMTPLDSIKDLRRNIVVKDISAESLNDMVGSEILLGDKVRLFAHRRTVPCKYREAQCKRPGLMNNLWGECGINCEILPTNKNDNADDDGDDYSISIGDTICKIPNSFDENRINIGTKPPGFFIRPADRSIDDIKKSVIPSYVAMVMCFTDGEGFCRLQEEYNSVGQNFFSLKAYQAGLRVKAIKMPLITAVTVLIISILFSNVFSMTNA